MAKRRKKQSFSGHLPDGTFTNNVTAYITAWRGVAKVFTDITGGESWAYEPNVCIRGSAVGDYELPGKVAQLLAIHMKQGEEAVARKYGALAKCDSCKNWWQPKGMVFCFKPKTKICKKGHRPECCCGLLRCRDYDAT